MLQLLHTLAVRTVVSSHASRLSPRIRRCIHSASPSRRPSSSKLLWGSAITLATAWILQENINLDSEEVPAAEDTRVDLATSIEFPTTLHIPSKVPLPPFALVGLGVRTVSFLGVKVYSVGFYADLTNSNLNIPKSATPEEKINHIVDNTACVLRIVPTRSTSHSHLRDGFMRALQGRLRLAQKNGTLSPEEEGTTQSPLRKLKSIFPNTPLAKHESLDVLLTAPEPSQPRSLIFRDLGSVQNDWVAREFVLAYFEGDGLSPPLKKSVVETLTAFGR